MRAAIDATFVGAGRGGDETFLRGVLRGLAHCREPDEEFPLLLGPGAVPTEVAGDAGFPVVRLPARPGAWHFAASLPRALRRVQPDLAMTVTHAPLTGRVPIAVTIGDLSFWHRPQDYPRATAARLRTLVPRHLSQARVVLVPSAYTRSDLLATFGLSPARVHVVPNTVAASAGLTAPAAQQADRWLAERGVRGPYLVYVGNLHPRKNVPLLIRSFLTARRGVPALREHRLVIAGGRWWRGDEEHIAAGGSDRIHFLGRVSDDVRSRLLARASALAYLSLFEGFGLPPLEAMAHGTPVLASSLTSLPEVCGNGALLVDPRSPTAVLDALVSVLTDETVRTRLRAAGPQVAGGYDAPRVGRAALGAFRYALGREPDPVGVGPGIKRSDA